MLSYHAAPCSLAGCLPSDTKLSASPCYTGDLAHTHKDTQTHRHTDRQCESVCLKSFWQTMWMPSIPHACHLLQGTNLLQKQCITLHLCISHMPRSRCILINAMSPLQRSCIFQAPEISWSSGPNGQLHSKQGRHSHTLTSNQPCSNQFTSYLWMHQLTAKPIKLC